MAYYQGNLALDEKKRPKPRGKVQQARPKTKQQTYPSRKEQPRVAAIPTKVKLTRLACVVLIACVSVLVMWRYTQIYQTGYDIAKAKVEIKKLQTEASTLKQEVEVLQSPERMQLMAQELGLNQFEIKPATKSDGNAAANSKAGANTKSNTGTKSNTSSKSNTSTKSNSNKSGDSNKQGLAVKP